MAKIISEKEQQARVRQIKAQDRRWSNAFNFLVKYLKRRGISVGEPCWQGTNVLVEKALPVAGHHILVVRGCGKCFHAAEIFDVFKRTNEISTNCKTRCRVLVDQNKSPRFLVPHVGPFMKEHQIFPGICPYPMISNKPSVGQVSIPHGHGPRNPRLEERRLGEVGIAIPEGNQDQVITTTPPPDNSTFVQFNLTQQINWDATVRAVTTGNFDVQ